MVAPSSAPSWLNWVCSAALQNLIPATLLITTPKRSALRYLSIPCMAWNASRFIHPVPGASPSWCNAMALMVVGVVQATNLLLLNPLDEHDLSHEKPGQSHSFLSRLYHAYEVFAQNRALNSPREIKNVPSQPAYYARHGGEISRGRFLQRQGAILLWQFCFLGIFQTLARQDMRDKPSMGFAPVRWDLPVDQFVERTITNLFTGVVLSRVLIDAHFRAMSIVHVGLGLNAPSEWPPAFGRIGDAYTVRRYWGRFWHQFLRQPFTAVSKSITHDILGIPRQSPLAGYTIIIIVFLMSGCLHVMVDITQAIPLQYSGASAFFSSTILGILIEEAVQKLWKALKPQASKTNSSPSPWMRAVGLAWVVTYMGVTSTWYFTPILQVPAEYVSLIPFNIVENVGFAPVIGAVVAGGLGLWMKFGIEI